jgi:phage terminase Nu1 subunit (DNA packaging protein)
MAKTLKPVSVIAEWLGISERRVQQMAAAGILPRAGRGLYDLQACVLAYVEFLRNITGVEDNGKKIDYAKERARLTKFKADLAEMEASQTRGDLIMAEDVHRAWVDMISHCRARLLAIPTSLAPIVYAKKSVPEITKELKAGIFEALEELSKTTFDLEGGEPGDPEGSEGSD